MAQKILALALAAASALTLAPAAGTPTPVPPVFELVNRGDIVRLKAALVADPALVKAEGPSRSTPLGAALNRKRMDAVKALLEAGADPNKPFGPTLMHPLQGAALRGLSDAVTQLLARGADPNGKDQFGGTALHEAISNDLVDAASALAGKGADVNARYTGGPNVGATPLHLAAKSKNMLLVIVLAAHQPKWNLKWNGRTPEAIAEDAGAKDVAAYIRSRQADMK